MHREPLTLNDLEWLGNYFERQEDHLLANHTWYDYYRMSTVSEVAQYTDNIPSNRTLVETQQSRGPTASHQSVPASENTGGFPWYFLMIPVLVLSGYFLWNSRSEVPLFGSERFQSKAAKNETDQFQQFLDEINARLHKEKPEAVTTRDPEEITEETEAEIPEKPDMPDEPESTQGAAEQPEIEEQKPADEEQDVQVSKQSGKSRIMLKQAEVMELYKSNMEPEMIARNLHMSRGEVELLIRISNEKTRKPAGTGRKKKISLDMLSEESIRELSHKMQISEEEAKIMRLKQLGN